MIRPPILLVVLALFTGCSVLSPRLPPVAPPPNQPDGSLLMEVPGRLRDAVSSPAVLAWRDETLAQPEEVDPAVAEAVRAHQVLTGMSKEQVIWSFEAHPDRVRWQGPPGGDTLLWVGTSLWVPNRYFVRFDERGRAVAAGRY